MRRKISDALNYGGVCAFGVVRARIFEEFLPVILNRGEVSLCERVAEKRVNPFLTYPFAKSIIVCLFNYYSGEKSVISEYALGEDYHIVIKNRLLPVIELLRNNGYQAECFTDNSPFSERHLAYLAGLGFFGMNGMLINKEFGSKVFIAGIVTDCELEEDRPIDKDICMQCRKCIEACPGGAIGENFKFDENRCVSFLTQKKGELSKEEENVIKKSGYIWGCDICQNVCPYNYSQKHTNIHEFAKSNNHLSEINENMTNSQFKKLFGDKAYSWRGKNVLIRNMNIFK